MSEEAKAIIERFREIVKGGERLMTDKELNEMIDWCKKKMLSLPFNYTGKRKEGYKEAMLQVMSYIHSKKGGEQE